MVDEEAVRQLLTDIVYDEMDFATPERCDALIDRMIKALADHGVVRSRLQAALDTLPPVPRQFVEGFQEGRPDAQ